VTLRHLVWRLREEYFPEKHPYDQLTGCDTSGMIHARRLGPDAEDYQPVDPDVFRAGLDLLPEELAPFTFVDVGCGKGRALLLAEEYPFRKITGVEFSGKLAKIAAANAVKIRSRRISVVHADARDFQFPPEPLVVFLYNPFSGDILRSVMKRLGSHPSSLYILYVNPVHGDAISALPQMKFVASDDWCTIWKRSDKKSDAGETSDER
jgi:SAM-dependent methyltransferase